jgi:hypothetical protein
MELCGFSAIALRQPRDPGVHLGKDDKMTSILILNAVSSFVAAIGLGGYLVRENRRARRRAAVVPMYVTTSPSRSQR